MTNNDIIYAFLTKRNLGRKDRALSSTGDRLFSYDTCIAQWFNGGENTIIINQTKYSVTSSRHKNDLIDAISCDRYLILTEREVPKGTRYIEPYIYRNNE